MEGQHSVNKQLLSRLTHHVRNPFNGIIGFTDLLQNHFEKLSDDDKKNYIQIVHQLSKKALLRSENLAWWLKFYTNNLTPVSQNIDIAEAIRDELNYFAAEIQKQHLDLQPEFEDNSIVNTDKVMFQSILKNVILNIVEYSTVGEVVDITLNKVKQHLVLTFTNHFHESPSEETIAFLDSLGERQISHVDMPDNPGIWTINTLCSLLNITLKIKMDKGYTELQLIFPK